MDEYEFASDSDDSDVEIMDGKCVVKSKIIEPTNNTNNTNNNRVSDVVKTPNDIAASSSQEPQTREVSNTMIVDKFPLPKQWDRNIRKINIISDFVENNQLDALIDDDYVNTSFDNDEFKELREIVYLLNNLVDKINDIDDGLITAREIKKPATVINRLLKIARNYVDV